MCGRDDAPDPATVMGSNLPHHGRPCIPNVDRPHTVSIAGTWVGGPGQVMDAR